MRRRGYDGGRAQQRIGAASLMTAYLEDEPGEGEAKKQGSQNNGRVMEGFVDTTFGAVDVARRAKSASKSTTFLLEEYHDNQ
jgi:hypothetical protein